MPGGPRGALVDEINGDSICDQIPLPHGHGSVKWRLLHDLVANEVSAKASRELLQFFPQIQVSNQAVEIVGVEPGIFFASFAALSWEERPETCALRFVTFLCRYLPRTSFDMCMATNMWGTSTTAPIFRSPAKEQRT